MEKAAKTEDEKEAMANGWYYFTEHLTQKYLQGNIPEGLVALFEWLESRETTEAEYS